MQGKCFLYILNVQINGIFSFPMQMSKADKFLLAKDRFCNASNSTHVGKQSVKRFNSPGMLVRYYQRFRGSATII